MKIAILGTRGVPANYGGFETFAQELSILLADKGHHILVYSRTRDFSNPYTVEKFYESSATVLSNKLPTIFHKYLETIVHSFLSFLDCSCGDVDVIILCNAANSVWIPIAKIRGIPVIVNVDGIERKRSKWNIFGKLWYILGEISSVLFANVIVADAKIIEQYYRKTYNKSSKVIAYGAERIFKPAAATLAEFSLSPKNYVLYVSRLEPENNALCVIRAYLQCNIRMPLVLVGDAPYAADYKKQLNEEASKLEIGDPHRRIIFAGFRFGDAYRELREHCYLYVQATQVGGTHPALVEAMMHANCVVANDVPEHREVLANAGLYYSLNDSSQLAQILDQLGADAKLTTKLGYKAYELAKSKYSWQQIAQEYEDLCLSLTSH
jgi:glycosyltransferase involved in cell wall biosynthesis